MELDLRKIMWPICLLKCNVALQQIRIDGELTLTIGDIETADNLIRIIRSYPDLTYEMTDTRQNDRILVKVKKRHRRNRVKSA